MTHYPHPPHKPPHRPPHHHHRPHKPGHEVAEAIRECVAVISALPWRTQRELAIARLIVELQHGGKLPGMSGVLAEIIAAANHYLAEIE